MKFPIQEFGLKLATVGFAIGWLAMTFAYTPLADKIATRQAANPWCFSHAATIFV
jgi:hypothetical protein